jgi:hypothetical protein
MLKTCAVVLCILSLAVPVQADNARRSLALALAQVAAHEGALHNARDLDLIWQVVQNHGNSPQAQLRWLRTHSARALGLAPARHTDGNAWSSELNRRGTIPASVAAGQGYWRMRVMPKWHGLLERAQSLVDGAAYAKPCPIEPITWGGPMDHVTAAADGRYPIGCSDVLNDGFASKAVLRAHGRTL